MYVKHDTSLWLHYYVMVKVDCMRSQDVTQSRFLVIDILACEFEENILSQGCITRFYMMFTGVYKNKLLFRQ